MSLQGGDNPSKFRDEWDKQTEGSNHYKAHLRVCLIMKKCPLNEGNRNNAGL